MSAAAPRSLRRAYLEWVEEQVEEFKESIPRSQLLALADQVVEELRMTQGGQYQLTEILLCNALDRYLVRMLKLPGYRAWCAQRRQPSPGAVVIPFRELAAAHAAAHAPPAEAEPEPVACVV
jgi:hypothetical protein